MTVQETSKQAFESTGRGRRSDRWKIFTFIAGIGESGCTCDQIEDVLGLKHQSASAAITHLRDDEYIYDSGLRRKTRSGRDAIVWRARPRE